MPSPPTPEKRCDHIWIDGDFVRWEDARVHVLSHALHYGSSVFEGIRCYSTPRGPAVFRLTDHVARLFYSARVVRIDLDYTPDEIRRVCLESVRINNLDSCYIRPLVFRGVGAMGLMPKDCPTHTMIASWKWGAYLGEEGINNGIDCVISSWTKFAPNTFPALAKIGGAYVLASMAKMEALRHGYAEALFLDTSGRVSEGTGENLFAVIDGRIHTPPLSHSILGGITRRAVLQLAIDRGYEIVEQPISREALYMAEEVFLTGTAAEVTPVRSVDAIPVGTGKVGPVTRSLQEDFFAIVQGRAEDRYGWMEPVNEVGAAATT